MRERQPLARGHVPRQQHTKPGAKRRRIHGSIAMAPSEVLLPQAKRTPAMMSHGLVSGSLGPPLGAHWADTSLRRCETTTHRSIDLSRNRHHYHAS
jgi:hypothetical protein